MTLGEFRKMSAKLPDDIEMVIPYNNALLVLLCADSTEIVRLKMGKNQIVEAMLLLPCYKDLTTEDLVTDLAEN